MARPPVIRDQDRIDVRLTGEAEYRIPFTFIEALNEGTLFDRPAHAFLDAARERRLFHVLNRTTDNIIGNGAPLHSLLEAGFRPIGPVDVHRGDIDAVIDHMIKGGESVVHMEGFVFGREAIGKLVLSLWKFVNEDHGVITRSDPAGDIRMTVDFSNVIPPTDLNI